jgi:3D (Asp-Asp-Asp) domain-containing protein
MRVYTVWSILLTVALSVGSDPLISPTAHAAWARTRAPLNAPPQRHAPAPRLRVTVTAYSHSGKTASGRRVRPGIVALSRDVEHALGVTFGERVVLEGLGTFVFDDRVSARLRRRVDIFVASPHGARAFGVTVAEVHVADAHAWVQPPVPPPRVSSIAVAQRGFDDPHVQVCEGTGIFTVSFSTCRSNEKGISRNKSGWQQTPGFLTGRSPL